MGFLGDILFGSEGEPAKAEDLTPPEFKALRQPISTSLQGLIESGGGPEFTGNLAAPATPQEQDFLSLIGDLGKSDSEIDDAVKALTLKTVGGDFLDPSSNPSLQAAIDLAQRRTLENFFKFGGENSRVRTAFTRGGHTIQGDGSSAFERTRNDRENQLLQNLGDIATQIVSGNFQAERERQQRASEFGGQLTSEELNRAISSLQASQLPRLIEQFGIDRGLEEFRRRISTLLQALGVGAGAAGPNLVTSPGSEGTTGLFGAGGSLDIGTIIGNLGGAAKAVSGFSKLAPAVRTVSPPTIPS